MPAVQTGDKSVQCCSEIRPAASCHVQPDRGPQPGPRPRGRQEAAGGRGRGLGPEDRGREQEIQTGPGQPPDQTIPGPDRGADTAAGNTQTSSMGDNLSISLVPGLDMDNMDILDLIHIFLGIGEFSSGATPGSDRISGWVSAQTQEGI